jgi:alkylation response protein AidB-like acyl-CoA dehydrogenase
MNLLLTEEQEQLAATLREFLARDDMPARVRSVAESGSGWDEAAWAVLARDIGVLGLAVPAKLGGEGCGIADVCAVAGELGAALTPVPFLASAVLATHLLLELGDSQVNESVLPDLLRGDRIGAVACTIAEIADGRPPLVSAQSVDGRYALAGNAGAVLNGAEASLLLVPAVADGELQVFLVEGNAPGLTRVPLTTLDLTRPQARLLLRAVPARLIGSAQPADALSRTLDIARIVLAAEQLGGMRSCLDSIVGYVKIRAQFGRVVGSFQGVKHRLADMSALLAEAESIARYGAWAADNAPGELAVAAALAHAHLGEAYFSLAQQHLLLFGGIGFTWEHDAHLYYKRAKTDELLFGGPTCARNLLADRLGLV